ncbi:galactose oxidase [Corynespora cassiicola Philippines]|uniref:Galactose oxidase n=1 Tax=Corynespora cassiicola Philippines TaxID=1448308 RepID=A0A2T2N2X6_CORCC|nr:galactose oxidase [Corynespora cassiicola Philippines]
MNSVETKKTTFVTRPARYVRITALSEAQGAGNQWSSAAEINIFHEVAYTSRSGWSVSADSQELTAENTPASNAVDGNAGSLWHTKYQGSADPLPHWFRIDAGSQQTVTGLAYLPRLNQANGRIGQYTVQASNDSTDWSQVAAGTWADDGNEKVASFSARARYFRLNALTEAGGRGPWTSAGEINLVSVESAPYVAPEPGKGLWTNTVDFPLVPAAAANLPNGKVLLWSAFARDNFGGSNGYTQTAIYDPTTGESTQRTVSNTQHDMFCPGISVDFNGRVVVTGGSNAAKTSIYDPGSDAWVAAPDMKVARGYQSTSTGSDGRIFNIGGSWSGGEGGKNGEIYDPTSNAWTLIQNALVSPMLTNDRGGVYRADNHAWLFGWKNKTHFQAGPSRAMNWYDSNGAGSTTAAGDRADDGDAMNGNAVMYDAAAGKILTAGGALHYQGAQARAGAYVITLGSPKTKPVVTKTASMQYARGFANGVALPDGTVFVTGGQSWVEPFTDGTAAYVPELWNPATGTWTQLNPMAIPRTYHSVALLLPDATVLQGGGGLCGGCGVNHFDAEIFVPPYLLNADGSRRARPVINSVASTVKLGASLGITTNSAVTGFSLVRFGSSTHTVNTDQRRIPLTPSGSGTSYTITIPGDAGVALPGHWFLFAINSAGTPSVARVIKVTT